MAVTIRTTFVLAACAALALVGAAVASGGTSTAIARGTTSLSGGSSAGGTNLRERELAPAEEEDAEANGDEGPNRIAPGFAHGKFPPKTLPDPTAASNGLSSPGSELGTHFQGINFRQHRLADGGNQFSVEPPDQSLCAGNGFVLESVNDAIQVFNANGTAASAVLSLNQFYKYPSAFNRTTGVVGPQITDPVCHYDPATQRWYHLVLTLESSPAGDLLGGNHLDLAVSNSSSPLGAWTLYSIDVTNDGQNGTPNHHCSPPDDPDELAIVTRPNACIGDYPHIGADKFGVYLTTNEYAFFGPEYNGTQIYALSKAKLAAGGMSVPVTSIENTQVDGIPGFTTWPAISPGTDQFATNNGGTEYFLSALAGVAPTETGNDTGSAKRIVAWAVTNTSSLDTASPALSLTAKTVNSKTYTVPPKAEQKPGPTPLRECINDTAIPTPFGTGCWNLLFVEEPEHDEVIAPLDSSDTRMQQVTYVNGQLYGALGTGVSVGGSDKAGIVWFQVEPKINGAGKIEPKLIKDGYVALAGTNLTYPAMAVLPSGKGLIGFTAVGGDHFPSAGYVLFDNGTTGTVRIAGAGLGPQDGFTSYKAFVGDPPRERWGDYGAAAFDGNSIWVANEYIAQTCTLAQYLSGAIGSCNGTRASLGNWSTHVSKVTP